MTIFVYKLGEVLQYTQENFHIPSLSLAYSHKLLNIAKICVRGWNVRV
ncbi:hypothetical protein ACSQ6I_14430 [Anabaena sp. WFMT]